MERLLRSRHNIECSFCAMRKNEPYKRHLCLVQRINSKQVFLFLSCVLQGVLLLAHPPFHIVFVRFA